MQCHCACVQVQQAKLKHKTQQIGQSLLSCWNEQGVPTGQNPEKAWNQFYRFIKNRPVKFKILKNLRNQVDRYLV
jgi:hypothetical protein